MNFYNNLEQTGNFIEGFFSETFSEKFQFLLLYSLFCKQKFKEFSHFNSDTLGFVVSSRRGTLNSKYLAWPDWGWANVFQVTLTRTLSPVLLTLILSNCLRIKNTTVLYYEVRLRNIHILCHDSF